MKKLIYTGIIFIIVFFIYYFNASEKIYYVSIGDYLSYGINTFENLGSGYSDNLRKQYGKNLDKYINYSSIDDYRVMDLINDINYNKEVIYNNNEYKLQNLLIKANVITLSIGMNDLIYKKNIDYNYIDELLSDIESLVKLVRKYNKDKIYFLSFYNIINNSDIIEYANKRIKSICAKNNIIFVDISNLDSYMPTKTYPTNEGYNYITDRILNFTK